MKVAFLIEQFDPARGGMERSAAEFLSEMATLGPELHVITQSGITTFPAAQVHILGRRGFGRAGRYRQFVTSARKYLAQERWDVVHAVTPCFACDLYQPRSGTARESLARTIAVRRSWIGRAIRQVAANFNLKQRLLANLEQQLLTGSETPLVAALSSYMRRQLAAAYGLGEDRIRDVFNGVSVELPSSAERDKVRQRLRAELNLNAQQPVAIFVAHNFRRKGLARLLEALAHPGGESWTLLVAGKDRSAFYERHARHLGLAPARTRFLGSRSDVRQLYLAADVGVLPSYYDPCSRTIIEAMSLGIPCIATRYDGSSDCIRSGENGFVIDSPECVAEMAEALRRLADPVVRQRLSAQALALRPFLSMRRHAEQIALLYQELGR